MRLELRRPAATRFIPVATTLVALLLLWPPLTSPFHTPKRWALIAGAGVALLASRLRWNWFALPFVGVTLLLPWRDHPAGLQAAAFAVALLCWPGLQPPFVLARRTLLVGGALVGAVVLLQSVGVDPFARARPDGGARLSLYGILGNPDFVASCLLPIALLGLPEKRWPWRWALVVIVAALMWTQSFGTLLALAAGAIALGAHPAFERQLRSAGPILLVTGMLALPLATRSPGNILAGRLYLLKVAAPHVLDAPMLGGGAGAFVRLWPEWELRWWQERCSDADCVSAHPDGRFTGRQDHAHNDWLELLLERGCVGLVALLVAFLPPFRSLWRRRDAAAPFIMAALVAALARAGVDFPFARPADLCLLALLVSLALAPQEESPCVSPSPS